MPDIKIKPPMDKPKMLEVSRAPKEAGFILKEQYEAQQAKCGSVDHSPVQYATDRVEATARRGADLAAGGVRRGAKRVRQAAGAQNAQRQEQAAHGTNAAPQTERQEAQGKRPQGQRRPLPEHRRRAAQGGAPQASPETLQPPTARERGRLRAMEDSKNRIKARHLTEKEPAALRGLAGAAPDGAQASLNIKQKVVGAKTRTTAVRGALGKDRLMTPAAAAAKKAKQQAQKKIQRQMMKQAAVKAKKAAQKAVRAVVRVAKAAARAIAAAVSAIIAAGGGVVLLVVILLVALIAVIAASPFGIFFSGERVAPGAAPVSVAVAEINREFSARLEELQAGDYDNVVMHGAAADWPEVLAVFASRLAGADSDEAADVVTMDRARIDRLNAVFWDMTSISSDVQEIEHSDSDPDDDTDDSWTEYILHITITAKPAAEMAVLYGFTPRQTSAMEELLAQRAMLAELAGGLSGVSADAGAVLDNLPADLSPERKAVVKAACSLVGKVNYFWGGKSLVIGWDSRWGQTAQVWAAGSSTTGTYRPYGLDCSGFVDWVFYQVSDGSYIIGHGGGATMQHQHCEDIAWTDAQPGDLVFYPGNEHVGIVCSRDESGNLLVIHCASSRNNVVVTGIEGFVSIARPDYYSE